MRSSSFVAFVLVGLGLFGCSQAAEESTEEGRDDALTESSWETWKVGQTLHIGETVHDLLAEPTPATPKVRLVHPFYVGANDASPVSVHFALKGEDANVQVSVLAPIEGGQRATLAMKGYDAPKKELDFETRLTKTGTYLLVVSTHKYATPGSIDVQTWNVGGEERSDAIVAPRSGALVGNRLEVKLNPTLANEDVELWTSLPAAFGGDRRKLATKRANGQAVTFDVANVKEGDDLWIVVPKKAPGTQIPIDSGTGVRFWKSEAAGIRYDLIGISDFGNQLTFTGVLPFFEGSASLSVVSADRKENGKPLMIGSTAIHVDRPGQSGMGLSMFDADVSLPLMIDEAGPNPQANPRLPANGEILAVGFVTEQPAFISVGCFEFCNDLRGDASCSVHEVECPAHVETFVLGE